MGRPPSKKTPSSQVLGLHPIGVNGAAYGSQGDQLLSMISGLPMLYDLRRMFLTDDTVGAMTWVISTTLQKIPWKHAAQIDGKDADTDATAMFYADWADGLMLDMNESWASHVEQCCELLWSGFLPFEIVTKQRDGRNSRFSDGLYGIRKMPLLDPLTVSGWSWDQEGDLTHMLQMGARAPLPVWKIALYQTFATEASPNGRSMLNGAWRPWRMKNRIQDSEAVGIDRDLCGLPVFKVPEELLIQAQEVDGAGAFTADALLAQQRLNGATQAVRDMRFNRSGGLIFPSDSHADEVDGDKTPKYDFKLVTTAGQRSIDTRTVIRDYDRAIARVAMMQFLHLGDRSTGSYGLSDDQSSMAMQSLTAFAGIIANEWSRKVLTLLWDINGFDRRYMPAMKAAEVSKESLLSIGTFLRGVGAISEVWSGDETARRGIARIAGFPVDRENQTKLAKATFQNLEAKSTQLMLPGIGGSGGQNANDH